MTAIIAQRRIAPVTAALLALTLAMSAAAAIDARLGSGCLYGWLALSPEAIWSGQIWRLITWPFLHGGPLGVIFSCIALYVFGNDLEWKWRSRRYVRFVLGMILAASAGTALVGLVVTEAWQLWRLGGMVMADALLVAWARQFPDTPVVMYMLLVAKGRGLIGLVVALTILFAAFFGIIWMLPEILAISAALVARSTRLRRMQLELRQWWLRRRLHVVRGGRT